MKKLNPITLPPAGKNFYDFADKSIFISAQKNGSYYLNSPNTNSYSI